MNEQQFKAVARFQRSKKPKRVFTCKSHNLEFYSKEDSDSHAGLFSHQDNLGRWEVLTKGGPRNFDTEERAIKWIAKKEKDKEE